MSYNKLGFTSGQTLKAEHLNYIEDGIANAGGADGIIDVVELPTENINKNAIYRLLTGAFVIDGDAVEKFRCHCVDTLPEIGKPVTMDMESVTAYYSVVDKDAYGYLPEMLGAQAGIPEGWYTLATLAPVFDLQWGGIVWDAAESTYWDDDKIFLCLAKELFVFNTTWTNIKQTFPAVDIVWDGNTDGLETLTLKFNGASEFTLYKVSNLIPTIGQYFDKNSEFVVSMGQSEAILKPAETSTAGGGFGRIHDSGVHGSIIFEYGVAPVLVVTDFEKMSTLSAYVSGGCSNGVYFFKNSIEEEEWYVPHLYVPSHPIGIERPTFADAMYLESNNGTKFKIVVDDNGTISATEATN